MDRRRPSRSPGQARARSGRGPRGPGETALDRYVKAPDPAYRFSVVATRPGDGTPSTCSR